MDVVGLPPAAEVGGVARFDEVARRQVATCAVVVDLLAVVAHLAMVPCESRVVRGTRLAEARHAGVPACQGRVSARSSIRRARLTA